MDVFVAETVNLLVTKSNIFAQILNGNLNINRFSGSTSGNLYINMPVSFSQDIISNLTLQQSLYINSLYPYSGTTITLNNTINMPSLIASECVVTDINKNLTSLQYSTTSSQNTIVYLFIYLFIYK